MFVRFVVGSDGQHHKELTGVLTEARLLRDRGDLTAEEDARLGDVYAWFNDNVPVPPFSTGRFPRTRSHGSRTTLVNRSRGCGTSWHCYGSTVSKSGFFARRILAESSTRTACKCSSTSGTGSSEPTPRTADRRGEARCASEHRPGATRDTDGHLVDTTWEAPRVNTRRRPLPGPLHHSRF